eukprot:13920096-Alexandrium_andersonii.AAC.1
MYSSRGSEARAQAHALYASFLCVGDRPRAGPALRNLRFGSTRFGIIPAVLCVSGHRILSLSKAGV